MTLYHGLTPEQRGLVEQNDSPIFTFPPDYFSRLWDAIGDVDPEFSESYRILRAAEAAKADGAADWLPRHREAVLFFRW